jgi:hypothetical protein
LYRYTSTSPLGDVLENEPSEGGAYVPSSPHVIGGHHRSGGGGGGGGGGVPFSSSPTGAVVFSSSPSSRWGGAH